MATNESKYKLGMSKWNLSGVNKEKLTFFSDAVFAIAVSFSSSILLH